MRGISRLQVLTEYQIGIDHCNLILKPCKYSQNIKNV